MKKYSHFYLDQLGYRGQSQSEQDDDGDWYLASDVDARIAELKKALRDVLSHQFADECQECGIGQSKAWAEAQSLMETGSK